MKIDFGSSTDDRVLADTNILIYAHDPSDERKHGLAEALLTQLVDEDRLVVSAQTLNEFYSVITKSRRPFRLEHEEALEILRDLAEITEVVPLTPSLTFRAMEAMPRFSLSFWDALIWAAAEAGAPILYTEDLQHGQEIDGVRIVNPFLPAA